MTETQDTGIPTSCKHIKVIEWNRSPVLHVIWPSLYFEVKQVLGCGPCPSLLRAW